MLLSVVTSAYALSTASFGCDCRAMMICMHSIWVAAVVANSNRREENREEGEEM